MPKIVPTPGIAVASPLRRFAPVLIVLAVVYAYSNATKGPFIFDDELTIVDNPSIRTLWPIWVPLFPSGLYYTAGRPLTGLSLAINYALDGLNPRGYHAGNILLHALAALVLFGVCRRTLQRLATPHADGIALATSLIWASHPLLTDAVTYADNRCEVLMGLFFLLTLYALLRSMQSPHKNRWLVVSVICGFATALSKEVGGMVPLVVLLFDVLILTGSWRQTLRDRRWYYACLWVIPLILPLQLMTASYQNTAFVAPRISPWQYLLMQSQIITRYIRLAIWPSPLVICYVDWPVPSGVADVWPWLLGIGGLFLLTLYGVIRKLPLAMLGVWFFLILAPTSSFIPLGAEPAAERRMYLSLAAIVLLAVLAFTRLAVRVKYAGVVATIVAVLALSQSTLWRNEDYASGMAMWADTVAKRPNNPRANLNLGLELTQAGEHEAALVCFDKALAAAPMWATVRVDRGVTLLRMGRTAEGIAELQRAVRSDPKSPPAWASLGRGYQIAGDQVGADQALKYALQLDPNNEQAKKYLREPATRETR